MPALFLDLYAPGLAAAGRAADARAVAPIRRDRRWLFLTGIRGLLAIALGADGSPMLVVPHLILDWWVEG